MEALSGFEPISFFQKLALTKFYISVFNSVGFHNQRNKEPLNTFLYTCKAQVLIVTTTHKEYNFHNHNTR